jgi:hypothetical protein
MRGAAAVFLLIILIGVAALMATRTPIEMSRPADRWAVLRRSN